MTMQIITEIKKQGFEAEIKTVHKNGCELEAIIIKNEASNVAPIIYLDDILKDAYESDLDAKDVAEKVIDIYMRNKNKEFDFEHLFATENILEGIRVGIQRVSNEEIVKRPTEYDGIESYLYLVCEDFQERFSIKLTEYLLDMTVLMSRKLGIKRMRIALLKQK